MNLKKYKPLYKQLLNVRKNVQNRVKLFKFKRQKWQRLQRYSQRQLNVFRRFRVKDQYQLTTSRFSNRGNSLKRKYKTSLIEKKSFRLFFGNLKYRHFKLKILKVRSKINKEARF